MSGHESYPPPGSQPPPPPGWQQPPPQAPQAPPGWQQQPPAGWPPPYPAPPSGPWPPAASMLGAAHKPGAIPLRPLGLGDVYDGAFKIIRYNPKATAGVAVLVTVVSTVLTLLTVAALLALGATFTRSTAFSGSSGDSLTDTYGGTAQFLSTTVLPMLLQSLGTLVVSGTVAHVVLAAATGRRMTIGQAWAATQGRRWRLVGLTLLLGLLTVLLVGAYAASWLLVDGLAARVLYGLVGGPLFVGLMWWFWIRVYYLPVPALMLEDVGVLGAIRRGHGLTRRAFWRTFGIALLTIVVTGVAASMLAVPFLILGEVAAAFVDGSAGVLAVEATTGLSTIVASAFVTPFTAAVATLQYVDLRMRKEAFDVELLGMAGIVER
ncbi:hypothetical protein [Nocardioides lianchengensis]|nr:hypothetical protein [Nocardioides lianchengensis]NYG13106.1 hypothetical protein [Nocardioides lianchengensis]